MACPAADRQPTSGHWHKVTVKDAGGMTVGKGEKTGDGAGLGQMERNPKTNCIFLLQFLRM